MKPKNALKKISLVAILAIPAVFVFNTKDRVPKEVVAGNTTTQIPAKQNRGVRPETENLRRQLAEARTQNRELTREILAMRSSTLPDNSEDAPALLNKESTQPPNLAADDNPYEDERIHPDNEFKMAEAIETLETDFWQERDDSAWTSEIETELIDALKQQAIIDTTLDAVQCHSNLCLVEFVHATPQAHDALFQQLGNMKPFFDGFMVKTEESGQKTRTLVYIPRPGEALPLPLNLLTTGESS